MQSGRFRREIVPRGIGAAHDQRKPRQRRFALEAEQPQHGVERAAFALMRNLDAVDVEGNGAGLARDRRHFRRIDEQNAGIADR